MKFCPVAPPHMRHRVWVSTASGFLLRREDRTPLDLQEFVTFKLRPAGDVFLRLRRGCV
jgi:hypothetical protein